MRARCSRRHGESFGHAVRSSLPLAGWLPDLHVRLDDDTERAVILDRLNQVGTESSMDGISAHLLACGVKRLDRTG